MLYFYIPDGVSAEPANRAVFGACSMAYYPYQIVGVRKSSQNRYPIFSDIDFLATQFKNQQGKITIASKFKQNNIAVNVASPQVETYCVVRLLTTNRPLLQCGSGFFTENFKVRINTRPRKLSGVIALQSMDVDRTPGGCSMKATKFFFCCIKPANATVAHNGNKISDSAIKRSQFSRIRYAAEQPASPVLLDLSRQRTYPLSSRKILAIALLQYLVRVSRRKNRRTNHGMYLGSDSPWYLKTYKLGLHSHIESDLSGLASLHNSVMRFNEHQTTPTRLFRQMATPSVQILTNHRPPPLWQLQLNLAFTFLRSPKNQRSHPKPLVFWADPHAPHSNGAALTHYFFKFILLHPPYSVVARIIQ